MTIPPIPTNPSELFSPFLPATFSVPEDENRRRTFLVDELSNFSDVINNKKIGNYTQENQEYNGEVWNFKSTKVVRNGFQTFTWIPSYPNTGVLTLTQFTSPAYPIQDVNPETVITLSYGTASKPPAVTGDGTADYFTYTNAGNPKISFTQSDTTIVITTTVDLSAYSGFIVIHYLRRGI